MKRFIGVLAAFWLLSTPVAEGGELDAEFGGRASVARVAPVPDKPSGELDAESPTQSCCLKRWLCACKSYRYTTYRFYSTYGYGPGYYEFGYGCVPGGFGSYGGFATYGGFGGYGGMMW